MTKLALASALGLVLATRSVAGAPPNEAAPVEAPADDAAPSKGEAAGADAPATDPEAPGADAAAPEVLAHDEVLPSGVRVVTARDDSLPVAAVILSVEVGTRDDPKEHAGLVHALAYHLQQGNRDLEPGRALATVTDPGGLASMAVGPRQVRFEALVPWAQLDDVLRVEAQRLRAPTISRTLWLKSLSYARGDRGPRGAVAPAVLAAAWSDPGLAHDGRRVGKDLGELIENAVGGQLARMFTYTRSTVVVVGPEDPDALFERVRPLFADLRPAAREVKFHAMPGTGPGPRTVAQPKAKGDLFVWAVPATGQSRLWAEALCGTLNRQRPAAGENKRDKVHCDYKDDARRPALVLRASTEDPEALVAARLERIASGGEEKLLASQFARARERLARRIDTPLEMAVQLASSRHEGGPTVPLDRLTGGDADTTTLANAVPSLLDLSAAVRIVAPGEENAAPSRAPTAEKETAGPASTAPAGTEEAPASGTKPADPAKKAEEGTR